MAESQPLEGPVNGGNIAGTSSENPAPGLATKRQRRPSVRLGDIGDQPATLSYDSYKRNRQWNESKYRHTSAQKELGGATGKASKTRPLMNLGNGLDETLDGDDNKHASFDGNLDLASIVNRKGKDFKAKRGGTKRVRSNWISKVDEGTEGDEKFSGGEGGEDWYRGFDDGDGSESPLKEQSPAQSLENTAAVDLHLGHGNDREGAFPAQRRSVRARVLDSREHGAVELDAPSDTEAREWKCGASVERNGVSERGGRCRSLEDGVRMWLSGLGLGRYAPVFEIHEVDEEVLPLLTLEDLKDMGINAVGSRRKLYCAIQKLAKGFS